MSSKKDDTKKQTTSIDTPIEQQPIIQVGFTIMEGMWMCDLIRGMYQNSSVQVQEIENKIEDEMDILILSKLKEIKIQAVAMRDQLKLMYSIMIEGINNSGYSFEEFVNEYDKQLAKFMETLPKDTDFLES